VTGFDTTPKPAFLRAMQNQRWNVAGALSELVDNGFGPGRGNARRVHITHNTRHRTITVLDDGKGMEAIGRLFQLGNTIGRTPGDIGLYGSGGTMAVLWLARKVTIWTLRDGQVSHDAVDWGRQIEAGEFPIVSNDWKPAKLSNTPADLLNVGHGTLIALDLAKERTFYPSNVKRDLAQTYAPGLRLGKELIWTTVGKGGETDTLADPLIMPDDPRRTVTFDSTLLIDDELLGVSGAIGLIEDLPQAQSKVAVGYGPRVIFRTRDCYESPDKTERFTGTGIAGWLDLHDGWQPYLATTKDSINDQPVKELLMGHVFDRIRPLLEQVETDKLDIELIDIAIMLETALDGRAHVDVPSAGKKHETDDGTAEVGRREGTAEPDQQQEPTIPADLDPSDDEGSDVDKKDPAVARVEICKLDDAGMEGLLCKAELEGDHIDVFVNQDHPVVKDALITKPVNRQLLKLMVVEEMAGVISENPAVLAKIFPPRAVRELTEREGRDQRGLIVRHLIDRVKGQAA